MELREFTSELTVILLSIVLITGISLIPTLQIEVQGQVQRLSPPPTPGTTPAPSTTPAPPIPGTTPAPPAPSTTPAPPAPSTTPAPPAPGITRPPLGFEELGEAADQTEGSGAVNQSAMVMIPQSSVMTILDNLQTVMDAVADDEDAMMALESVDQELRSAATAAGMSVENTTDGGDAE